MSMNMTLNTVRQAKRAEALIEANFRKLLAHAHPSAALNYKNSFKDILVEIAQGELELEDVENKIQEDFHTVNQSLND